MNQETVLAALEAAEPDLALAVLARGPRAIDCPDLGSGRLVLPRYREVRHVLRDPGFTCAPTAAGMLSSLPAHLRELLAPVASWVLYTDAPLHPRMRALLSKAFTARRILDLQDDIDARATALVGDFVAAGGGNAVTGLAEPLPVHTISALLGIPSEDRENVKAWSDDVVLVAEPELSSDQEQRAATAWARLAAYFEAVIEDRRAHRGADVISGLVEAEAQGDHLTDSEIVANCIALLVGGHETTSSLLSSLLLAAVGHPELQDSVLSDEDTARSFVEEVLRFDGPSKITARTAVEDTDLFGVRIEAGRRLVLLQASANRDPEAFDSPDEFQPTRQRNPHLGFGHGPHACFGATLARMQAVALLRAYMSTAENCAVDRAAVTWKPSQVIRAAANLPISVRPALGGGR
ncbi:cytochrome P450 [Streptacidiphilus sp. MAP5-3]|uniref:cytochrome P450 n=1 Tax=unclassified Streptacidiphilus TaxID=2643834 RepID=UPI0035194D80